MPDKVPIPQDIADEAAHWFAERDSGLLTDEAALADWLAADPRHAQAFAEMEGLWGDLGGITVPATLRASLPVQRTPSHANDNPRRWRLAAVAASIALVAFGAAQDWPMRLRADAVTAIGERRSMALPDGSQVVLNTHSAVAFAYRADRRVVRLLRGEAAFTVAPDARRPFTVEANGGSTTALGTRFVIREDGAQTRVSVTQHRVKVAYAASGSAPVMLSEGRSLTYGPGRRWGVQQAINSGDADAWTQGQIVFENQPLAEVVAELGRYRPGYIRVIGGDLGQRRVSGVFSIDDPVGAVARLQHSLGLRSMQITSRFILIFA
ncbi:FecR family protein [Novosphingobium terrae]|uniref:FecR family protein n=1 Tax=Novosphingobium terrae TaxID=2726189 RepID=UPI00197F1E1D|nr:FecR family protein [Novosphingobium terrae]